MAHPTSDALLHAARDGFTAAAGRVELVERRLRVAGRLVVVEVAGAELAAQMLPAIEHLAAGPADRDEPPSLRISVWSSSESGVDAVPMPASLEQQARYVDLSEQRCVMAWPGDDLLMAYDRPGAGGGPGPARAWWWVPDHTSVPMFELAMPFRPIFHWWGPPLGLQMVHAAAIGRSPEGAVLLGGASGSGKSTTSLWSLSSDTLQFLGDDYVLVDTEGAPTVSSLYSTAKVHEPDQARVPHVRAQTLGGQEADKLVVFVGAQFPDRLVASLPLRAVILPRVSAEGPALQPVTAVTALRRLGPSTVVQFPSARPDQTLRALSQLVQQLPCFDLATGPDPAGAVRAVEDLLDRLGPADGAGALSGPQ
jgi:hypothetical protein